MYSSEKTLRDDRRFSAHIADLMAQAGHRAVFTAFLDLHQRALARAAGGGAKNVMFFGGYPGAQRVMFGAFPAGEEPDAAAFPISPLTIHFRKDDAPDHRDLLGAILALGLGREAVGDILVCEDYAVCFVTNAVAPLVLEEFDKAGKRGVRVESGCPAALPEQRFDAFTLNIPSARLDAIVAAALSVSRERAAHTIGAGLVKADDVVIEKPSQPVSYGTTLSIRGFGKFIFEQELRATKKGRLVISCKKFV